MPRRTTCAALLILIPFAFLTACTPDDRSDSREAPPATAPSALPGTVRGSVRLGGAHIPDPALIENTTDPEICGAVQQSRDLLVDAAGRGIANVIVSLRDVPAAAIPSARPTVLVLDNRDCQFVPRVAVLTVGSTVEAVSHDATLHTAHLYGALERNIALPDASTSMTVTVPEPGMIAVLCDVHGWMKAFIRVDTHPFHAVTDVDGSFMINGVPAGSYELDIWHERLGTRSVSVRVAPGSGTAVELVYESADR